MWLDPTNLPLVTPKTLQNLGAESAPPFDLKVSHQDVADRVNPDDNLPSFTDWNSDSTAN